MSNKLSIILVGRGWTGKKLYNELKQRDHNVSLVSHTELMNDSVFDNKYDLLKFYKKPIFTSNAYDEYKKFIEDFELKFKVMIS